jgi:hypothetical protein
VGDGIRADPERALLGVAYDTMARWRGLVAMDVKDVTRRLICGDD